MKKLDGDTVTISELATDVLQTYCSITQKHMKQWMHRIAETDNTAEIIRKDEALNVDMAPHTHWPEDVMKCIAEQIMMVHRELEEDTRDTICILIIKLIIEFIAKKEQFCATLNQQSTNAERLCAHINNNRRFIKLLTEREHLICSTIKDAEAAKYAPEFKLLISKLGSDCEATRGIISKAISVDFKEEMSKLFSPAAGWLDGPAVVNNLKLTLHDFCADLKGWLTSKEDLDGITASILDSMISFYVKTMLGSPHLQKMDHVYVARLKEDAKLLEDLFKEFAYVFDDGEVGALKKVQPLNDIVHLCAMEKKDIAKDMQPFVKGRLWK